MATCCWQIIVTTGVPDAVNSQAYFQAENNLIRTLLKEQAGYIDSGSIVALSFFNGASVDYNTSRAYLTPSSAVYDSVDAVRYQTLAGSLRSKDFSASLILVETIVDPDAEGIVPFVVTVRRTLLESRIMGHSESLPISAYLSGGFCSTYDVQVHHQY